MYAALQREMGPTHTDRSSHTTATRSGGGEQPHCGVDVRL